MNIFEYIDIINLLDISEKLSSTVMWVQSWTKCPGFESRTMQWSRSLSHASLFKKIEMDSTFGLKASNAKASLFWYSMWCFIFLFFYYFYLLCFFFLFFFSICVCFNLLGIFFWKIFLSFILFISIAHFVSILLFSWTNLKKLFKKTMNCYKIWIWKKKSI